MSDDTCPNCGAPFVDFQMMGVGGDQPSPRFRCGSIFVPVAKRLAVKTYACETIAELRAALAAREPAEKAVADGYKQAATFLWDLLDDIDTAGDMAKGDDKLYRAIVERHQRRRFEVGSTDGHSLELKTDAMLAAAKEGKPS